MFSKHFSIQELTITDTGLQNDAPTYAITSLQALCSKVLEPIRTLLDVPMHVDSAYRSSKVNKAVRGATTSQHLLGQACDFVPQGLDLEEAFQKIKRSEIPYDQLILEPTWLHVSVAPEERKPRRQTLKATFPNGRNEKAVYQPH